MAGKTVKKILVIEDNAKTRNLFLRCLKSEGFYPIGAEDGIVGLERLQENTPDLIICDIKMPKLDGYGVVTKLRQDPVTAVIPFIFVTGRATRTDIRKGMELGADDYLTKPCTFKELLATIAVQLEKQANLRQWYGAESQQVPEQSSTDPTSLIASNSIFPACPQMSEVFRFIESFYNQPITLCDVAQAVGYSPAYLTNLMRQQTGKSVHRWIVERRMTQAHSLLLETEQAVNQIAEAVGYQDACHFSRYFRQLYGTSPQAWRSARRRIA
jgi:YesN/AraC family two-component response regulator